MGIFAPHQDLIVDAQTTDKGSMSISEGKILTSWFGQHCTQCPLRIEVKFQHPSTFKLSHFNHIKEVISGSTASLLTFSHRHPIPKKANGNLAQE